jgi:hypothetical protein
MAPRDGPAFAPGQVVRLNELSNAKARYRDRTGVVMGPSRKKGNVRVLWTDLKRPQIVDASWLQLADNAAAPVVAPEIVIATISDELEKLRDARFERHLNMPRERPVQITEPWLDGASRTRRVAGIIGLTAAGMALGAAFVLFGW